MLEVFILAIVDSGVDDKKARIKVKKRFKTTKNSKDPFGHGTAVASIISGSERDSDSVKGIHPQANIFDVNVLDENGNASVDEVVKGIEWSIDQKVDIINMSFGIEKDDSRLRKAVEKAIEEKIIVVAAAGNTLGLYTEYPAKYENVLSISAVDQNMTIFKYAAKEKIDFVAPGVNIQAIKTGKLSKQESLSGTSFAAAHATGIIAKLLSAKKINKTDYYQKLIEFADLPEGKSEDPSYGYGLLKGSNK
jgi:subtilisin family serine protease